jgi:hypothetical protein
MSKQKIDLVNYVPLELRNERSTSLLSNLFNRFLAEEQSVVINGQIGKITDTSAAVIDSPNLDREQNALVPALYVKTGTEEKAFTFDDLIAKMDALGIDTTKLNEILLEQSLNYAPPINFDKFVNYSNYFWYGKALKNKPVLPWNPDIDPEYYVQQFPKSTSTQKLPVRLVADRDLRMYGKDRPPETVEVLFTSPTTVVISGNQGTLYSQTVPGDSTNTGALTLANTGAGDANTFYVSAPSLQNGASGGHGMGDSGDSDLLFSFTITIGSVAFSAGDKFQIDITYVTGGNSVRFIPATSGVGKGFLSNISPDATMMLVDGVRVQLGDAVLLTAQTNPAENGVYIVDTSKWQRAPNFNSAQNWPLLSRVYVTDGDTYSGSTWELQNRFAEGAFNFDGPATPWHTYASSKIVNMDFESGYLDTGAADSVWTTGGTGVSVSSTSPLAGTQSLHIANTTSYLETAATSTNMLPAHDDWKIKLRANWTNSAGKSILSNMDPGQTGVGSQFLLYYSQALGGGNTTNGLFFYLANGTTFPILFSFGLLPQGVTYDIEVERIGNTIIGRINGTQVVSAPFTGNIPQPSGRKIRIGLSENTNQGATMYFDSFEIWKSTSTVSDVPVTPSEYLYELGTSDHYHHVNLSLSQWNDLKSGALSTITLTSTVDDVHSHNVTFEWDDTLGEAIITGISSNHSGNLAHTGILGKSGLLDLNLVGYFLNPEFTDWQRYNFWAHKNDIDPAILDDCVQAARPIIEYLSDLQLNGWVDQNNNPAEEEIGNGFGYRQEKVRFNQIPQFDLFYYDGTHAGVTSGIFFYAEDPDFTVDPIISRRLKTTVNSDYVLGLGIKDEDDRLLFWKENDVLKTIWAATQV